MNKGAVVVILGLGLSLAACGSGAATDGASICATPPASVDEPAVAAMLARTREHLDLDGTWQNGRQGTVLSLDVTTGAAHHEGGSGCGGQLVVDATATVTTRDGVIDAHGPALLFAGASVRLELPLPDLPDAYAHPQVASTLPPFPSGQGLASGGTAGPRLIVAIGPSEIDAFVVGDPNADETVLGLWSSASWRVPFRFAAPYAVPAALADDCAAAADYTAQHGQYAPFASGTEALAAMTGTWLRCRAYGGPDHAGLQISDDRTWRDLTWQGDHLATVTGFRREGTVGEPIDTSVMNGPGFFQVNLEGASWGRNTFVWGDHLIVSNPEAPSDLKVDVYVRTARPVTPIDSTDTPGTRGGQAACAHAETGTIDPELGAPLEAVLGGDWTLCEGDLLGGYTGLTFDGHGGVTLRGGARPTTVTRSYQALHPQTFPAGSPRRTILAFPVDETEWAIVLSERPLKLWLHVEPSPAVARDVVFSAVP